MRKLKIDKNIILVSSMALILLVEIILIPLGFGMIFNLNKKISKMRQDLIIVEKEWPNKDSYLKRSEALRQETSLLQTKFILPQQESTLFSYLSSESKNFNVQIKALKPAALQDYTPTKLGKFKYLPIIIEARSSSYDLVNFLSEVHGGKYFLDITEMRITSDSPYHSIEMVICGLLKEN